MKLFLVKNKIAWVTLGVAAAAIVVAQGTKRLYFNGEVASEDVRIINGVAYAPLRDIAKAMGTTVAQRPDGSLEIVRQGGANQVEAKLNGKVGDWLFDGGWRFKVVGFKRVANYKKVNPWYSETEVDGDEQHDLLVIDYVFRNGMKSAFSMDLGGNLTSVANEDGSSNPVENNDFKYNGGVFYSKPLLPGAEMKGALIVKILKTEKPKDLIVEFGGMTGYTDEVKPKEPTVLRISLSN